MEKRRDGTIEHNTLPLVGRERNTLSVTDRCRYRAVMVPLCASGSLRLWSILLTLRNFALALSSQGGTLAGIRHWLNWRWPMPRYYFDIQDGQRIADPSGSDLKNDDAAIAKAKVIAIGVSLDKPAVDPKRHIAVLNGSREQIFSVPVYSRPAMSST